MSGGVDENSDPINDFWIINYNLNKPKDNFEIKNIKMPINKKQHSMLFNNTDNSVIIVGGKDKKCLIFDIKNETFSELPEINDLCLNPALIIINNYLYIFDSFDRKKKYFEKINLEKKEKFEKFYPKNYCSYNNLFYGVCRSNNDNNIIFCGGQRNGINTIIYEISKDDLIKSKGKDIISKLNDKTFYKINNNYYANIPDLEDQKEKSIIILDLRTNDTNKIIFDDEGKTTFKFDTNEENDISIEPIFMEQNLSKSLHMINFPLDNEKKNNNGDIIVSHSFNNDNDLNMNSDEIKLKSSKNRRNLEEIKNNDDNNNNISDDNKNNELENFEINVEQEAKQNENEAKLYKFKNPKLYKSGNLLNDQISNISKNKEEEKEKNENKDIEKNELNKDNEKYDIENENKEEEKFEIENNEEKNDNKENEKEERYKENQNEKRIKKRYMIKSENKYKYPINLKLNQSQLYNVNNINIKNSSYDNSSSNKSKIFARSYLNLEDPNANNEYNNYLFYEMKPNFKSKKNNILNASSNLEMRIKNPLSKGKIIKKKEINGLNYSVICEKIIDKSNLPLYESVNMQENYSIENDFGNHKLYVSQYSNAEASESFPDFFEIFEKERKTQQPKKRYKTNIENVIKTERNKRPNNIVANYNYNYFKEKNDQQNLKSKKDKDIYNNNNNNYKNHNIKITNYSGEKKKIPYRKYSNSNERKTEPTKSNKHYLNERIIEPNKPSPNNNDMPERKSYNSNIIFEPTKLRTDERKIDINYNQENNKNRSSSKDIKKRKLGNEDNNFKNENNINILKKYEDNEIIDSKYKENDNEIINVENKPEEVEIDDKLKSNKLIEDNENMDNKSNKSNKLDGINNLEKEENSEIIKNMEYMPKEEEINKNLDNNDIEKEKEIEIAKDKDNEEMEVNEIKNNIDNQNINEKEIDIEAYKNKEDYEKEIENKIEKDIEKKEKINPNDEVNTLNNDKLINGIKKESNKNMPINNLNEDENKYENNINSKEYFQEENNYKTQFEDNNNNYNIEYNNNSLKISRNIDNNINLDNDELGKEYIEENNFSQN